MKNFFLKYTHIFKIALEAVFINKFRSLLTALGIIFGVAAVIAMLAIGKGAQQEIIEQMKMIGVNNIIVRPIKDDGQDSQGQEQGNDAQGEKSNYSPGLNIKDVHGIEDVIPHIKRTSPEVTFETFVMACDKRKKAKLTGITNHYFNLFNLELSGGNMFSEKHHNYGDQVCIIGEKIADDFFVDENPLGNWLKCGHLWLKVIGVIRQKNVNTDASDNLGITNHNKMVFAPIQTVFLRYNDRSAVQVAKENQSSSTAGSSNAKIVHQLDKLVVQVDESKHLKAVSKVLKRLLLRRHNNMKDVEIIIPELLLKQEQRTRDIFNIVLGAIASISLIVGGIGIMNIMLASVTERTKEIGIRLAIGARKKDVVVQFISEATFISLVGGFFGIFLGALIASLISRFADIPTIISLVSILVSFGVSAGIGILFGYMPAKKAAHKDPVTSLRYE